MEELLTKLKFDQDNLIPAIAQQYNSKEVLMMAWMNKESIIKTFETKKVHYWSRSRQKLWLKGESSGHIQKLIEFYYDCDNDTLLLMVDQIGAACHTYRKTCFFNMFKDNKTIITCKPIK